MNQANELKYILDNYRYDKKLGKLFFKKPGSRRQLNKECGWIKNGYREMFFLGKRTNLREEIFFPPSNPRNQPIRMMKRED